GHHPGGRTGVFLGEEAQRNLALTAAPAPEMAAAGFGLHDATHVLADGRVQPVWRARGIGRTLRRDLVRYPAFHPGLRGPIRAGRSVYRWIRRAVLRSRAGEASAAMTGRRLIHCFGDHNALVFGELRWRGPLERTLFDLTIAEDASGAALKNG